MWISFWGAGHLSYVREAQVDAIYHGDLNFGPVSDAVVLVWGLGRGEPTA
jgi:hypothetical protein